MAVVLHTLNTKPASEVDCKQSLDLREMYCRLCMKCTPDPCRLAEPLLDFITVQEAIESLVGTLDTIDGKVPTVVCQSCTQELRSVFTFQQKCQWSYKQMQTFFEEWNIMTTEMLGGVGSAVEMPGMFTEALEMFTSTAYDDSSKMMQNEALLHIMQDDDNVWEYEVLDYDAIVEDTEYVEVKGDNEFVVEALDSKNLLIEVSPCKEETPDISMKEKHLVAPTNEHFESEVIPESSVVRELSRQSAETRALESEEAKEGEEEYSVKRLNVTDHETDIQENDQLPDKTDQTANTNVSAAFKEVELLPTNETPLESRQTSVADEKHQGKPSSEKQRKSKPGVKRKTPQRRHRPPNLVVMPVFEPHTCYYCSISFENDLSLEQHMTTHIALLPYTCPNCHTEACPMVFSSLLSMNRHLQSHQFPYSCPQCPKRFMNRRSKDNHVTLNHLQEANADGYKCDRCGAHFERLHQIRRHMRAHENEDSGRFRCDYCQRAFGTAACLKRHRLIHTGDKPFECQLCGKRFNHLHNFTNHKRVHNGERVHVCEVCKKAYTTGTGLRHHMVEHFPDDPQYGPRKTTNSHKPRKARYPETVNQVCGDEIEIVIREDNTRLFKCTIKDCTYETNDYHRIFYHRRAHTKQFECDRCGKRFAVRNALTNHIAFVHERQTPREKKHICPHCGKPFATRQKLKLHIDVHEGNKSHRCRFCDKAFVQKINCTAHERIHTGEMPFHCDLCRKGFASASKLRAHNKQRHENEMNAEPLVAVE